MSDNDDLTPTERAISKFTQLYPSKTIYLDSAERKSVVLMDEFFSLHPKITANYKTFQTPLVNKNTGKRVFDVKCANKGIELKIDDDLESSLNSGHLEQQIRDMKDYLISFPDSEIWVVTNCQTPVALYRLNTLCQNYGIWWAGCYKKSIPEKIMEIIQGNKKNRDSRLPVRQGHHNQSLEEGLAHFCAGFTPEFAHFMCEMISRRIGCDLNELTPKIFINSLDLNEISVMANIYYKKQMSALAEKIAKALGV